jgi:glycosyltransferase involved in cell wall biosynthesis
MSEYKLIKKLCERKIPITVISSGIKKRIIEDYGLIDADKIKVIVNGTNTNLGDNEDTLDIHKEYQIPKDSKIILYVGTISKNKNQTQFIKAFDLLNSRVKDNLYLLILGNIKDCPEIKKMIEEKELTKHIKLCGFVSKNKLTSYYKIADYNALVSLDEGFGLSIIEAFVYGVPTITFNDLDAVEDIYDERAVYLVNKRTDEDLAKGIENFVGIEWDTEFIRGYAKKFSLERMAEEYNRLYIELLKGNSDAENKQFKQN